MIGSIGEFDTETNLAQEYEQRPRAAAYPPVFDTLFARKLSITPSTGASRNGLFHGGRFCRLAVWGSDPHQIDVTT